ncbi:MAG: hypothetical protein IKZ13_08515 [Akkermansia sp.]|nr:hypothetical protein [Akkermansia sp.]
MDKGSLYRLALARLGDSELVEGSPVFKALEECAPQAVALAVDYTCWRFALKGPLALVCVDGVAQLPGDCLELREVRGVSRWELAGRNLVVKDGSNAAQVEVIYKSSEVADMMALPRHEPLFCEACVCLVAAAVAARVTGNARLGMELEQMGMNLLYRAKLKEVRSVSSNDQNRKEFV